jgi:hypothetical protein
MGKIPVGSIPLSEAFKRYYQHRYADAPSLDALCLCPVCRIYEERQRSTEAQMELMEIFASGKLEQRVYDGTRELTIRPGQLKDTASPARSFFGGPIEDCHNGPLADYRGLDPYTDETAFNTWLGGLSPDKKKRTAPEEARCKDWLVKQMRNGPPAGQKPHYLEMAKGQFAISDHGFLHRVWHNAIAEAGAAGKAWSKPGRPRKS